MDDARRVLLARALRGFADGSAAILLPVHLSALGFEAVAVGAITAATLLGSALLTLGLGLIAHRMPRRRGLLVASLLMACTGTAFALLEGFWPLLLVALFGTLNPAGGDAGPFLPFEHTVLAETANGGARTAMFARYSFLGTMAAAVGALATGAVDWLAPLFGREAVVQGMFLLYGALGVANLLLYRRLSRAAEAPAGGARPAPLGPSRRRVYGLAALFSLDAFGGGFVVQSLLALWLFERFGLDVATAGAVFFTTQLCGALSLFAAVPIARRIGLVNTMVFTHLPSNLFLIAAAFAPEAWSAVGLLVLRSLLSQMDVPARSAFVMAIVEPAERPAAASLTSVPRGLAASVSPLIAGWMLTLSAFGWPLVVAGALKLAYDLALLRAFARVRPPEEGG
ncbi:ABC transporter permease [Caldovatus sediminis]|uniref:ABC transporter permease n=1 Tax=Caldovatus sediminis TaxID=2041189 RepID=A0A8J2ZAG6_9PROT|nr:MFS transporter [Caldovatus sediminis]GGG28962.1 ABC transporter permease [Caldovatus sediminis]